MDIGSAPDITMGIAPEIFVKLVWILSAALLFLIIYYLINIGNRFVPDKKVIHYNTRLIVWVIVGLFGLYFITKIFNRYPLIADTFYTIIISLILAYFLNPLVDFFEKKGLNRFISTVLVYLIILGTIVILTISVLPRTGRELRRLATNFPGYITAITNWLSSLYSDYTSTIEGMPELVSSIEKVITQNVDRLQAGIANGIESFIMIIAGMFTRIISWILTPILTFYFLMDKNHFIEKLKTLIPKKNKEETISLFKQIDTALSEFIRGRLLMAVIVGITTTIFLFLMGIEFAIVIGFITGIADIIPYIGPFLGFVPAVIFAFIAGPIKALWVGIFFILIQWAENNILGPKILGKTTGMHPLTILLSIIAGGTMFGVMGMLLAVPFVSVMIILYKYFKNKINNRFPKQA